MNSERKIIRKFNTTGVCYPHLHYMAERTSKINEILNLVEEGNYFTINRPRQYGKTTVLFQVEEELEKMNYFVLSISFEGISDEMFVNEERFARGFIDLLFPKLEHFNSELADSLLEQAEKAVSLHSLSHWIKKMIQAVNKKVVLQIDEVDSSSNNQLFLRFLGMLRTKYLNREKGLDLTFFSVMLSGVHDVKNLKLKLRPDVEHQLNSPWNIAVDFDVDLNLSPDDIADMLNQYTNDRPVTVDIPFFADQLFYLTSGYPFLVSYLCKMIDEKILPDKKEKKWTPEDLENAFQMTLLRDNTNFESLIGKLENNPELYDFVFDIVMHEREYSYNPHEKLMRSAFMYGILKKENGGVKIHNRLYEQIIYNFMVARLNVSNKGKVRLDAVSSTFIRDDGSFDIEKAILKFQEFMKEQYSSKDTAFIERNGRLLFLAFLKPILNGKGYDFKEVQTSEEKRIDVIVTYGNEKFIIELKKWYGDKAHQKGLEQLADYLDRQNRDTGYLLIYDSRKESNRIGENETVTINNKQIFMVWV